MNISIAQSNIEMFKEKSFFLFTVRGRLIVGGVILSIALILIGIFFYNVYAQVTPYQKAVSAVGGLPAAAVASSTRAEPMREVHIANNGLMLVRGATVVSNTGGTIHISILWGDTDLRWAVKTTDATKFLTVSGDKMTLINIQVGEIISVTGMIIQGGEQPTINAEFVREL